MKKYEATKELIGKVEKLVEAIGSINSDVLTTLVLSDIALSLARITDAIEKIQQEKTDGSTEG